MNVTSRHLPTSDAAVAEAPALRRLSVDDYHRMVEVGILGEDDRVQLVEGVLVAMTPQGRPHAFIIQHLTRLLVQVLGPQYAVLPQLPLTLGHDSEPEPDLAVVRAEDARSRESHPTTALLVIEVATDSLRYDRKVKGRLYARSRIPEYWIVNLTDRLIEVRRDPEPAAARYRTLIKRAAGEDVIAASVPGVRIPVAELLG